MKKVLSIVLSLVLLFSVSLPVAAATTDSVDITVFHFNDTHGRIEGGSYSGMGFAKAATYVNAAREAGDNVLLLDAGDTFHGQPIVTIDSGASAAQLMNKLGVDAQTAGNHDFNYGQERLLELQTETTYPILGANVLNADGTPFLEEYVIKEFDGVKVAIFGLSTPETTYKTHPDNVKGLTFEDPTLIAKRMVETLTPMADVIICLGHIGNEGLYTAEAIAEAAPGIDVFVDGHSHSIYNDGAGTLVGSTLIVQADEYLKTLGQVTITVADGLVSSTASLITMADATDTVKDPDIDTFITGISVAQEPITSAVVGTTDIDLDGDRADVRTHETNLGNLLAESILAETGADVAFTNGGGIRDSISAGDITKGDILTVLPFGNYVVTKEITGASLRAMLEVGLAEYPEASGAFPHIAGMTVTFDPNLEANARIIEVMVGDKALDDAMMYTLASNDYSASGGDEYPIGDYPLLGEYDSLDEILMAYINENGTDIGTVTGRIAPVEIMSYTIVDGDFLWKIARKYGLTWETLAAYNNIANGHLIYAGDTLMIPSK